LPFRAWIVCKLRLQKSLFVFVASGNGWKSREKGKSSSSGKK
jgi:hypothetical protein